MTKEIPKIYRKAFHALIKGLTKEEMLEFLLSLSQDDSYDLFHLIENEVVQNFPNEFMNDEEIDKFLDENPHN